jgi:WD40 repeat protein
VLRLETGMHVAAIKRIGVDAEGRFLATASNDKTLRLWDLRTGALIRTLRPPLGEGAEGMLYAAAMSPDGSWVAAGGRTGYDWDAKYSIYVFDRASGRLVHRLPGLPGLVDHLAFSPDGRWLAGTLGEGEGVRVYRTRDFSLLGEDAGYERSSYGCDFARDGRLVTTSFDGTLRLYQVRDDGLRLLAKKNAPGGKAPYSARFSPDGSKIAIGFDDSTSVDVLDGRDLSPLYAPDTSGVTNGNLIAVSWSADGRMLYAGGRFESGTRIRAWSEEGRGGFRDLPAAGNTILDILPLATGGVVFGAFDPAWGVLDAKGAGERLTSGGIADYRNNLRGFSVSRDGTSVRFAYEIFGKSPARFDVKPRTLTGAADAVGLEPARVRGLDVEDWEDKYTPKLSGKALALEQDEISRSLAIAPDAQDFVLGADWSLRLYRRDGEQRWYQAGPGVAWEVNVSGDGRLVVAAFGDGTIRWYRLEDGQELLALFPHADRKRWVLWTPSGYYDASPGGEDLIGWHVNRGRDQAADYFPASRFREAFHRPDVVSRVLETLDEVEALRLANEEGGRRQVRAAVSEQLPPVVEILAPLDGATFAGEVVAVRFRVRAPADAPARALRVRVNGQAVGIPKAAALVGQAAKGAELLVQVPGRDSQIQVFAENRNAWSPPATVRLAWGGKVAQGVRKPRLYVLAVGVSHYRAGGILALEFAHKDAADFAAAMKQQEGRVYEKVELRLVPEEKAERREILKGLAWLRKEVTAYDVGILFFSGHGDEADGRYYFLPVDAEPDDLLGTAVPKEDILHTLSGLAGKAVFFMDSCRAGLLAEGGRRKGAPDMTRIVNELMSAENGVAVYASSTGRQSSLEDPRWQNGAFTKALVEGLSGKAAGPDGAITHQRLGVYLSDRVKDLTKGRQHPVPGIEGVVDFPIAAAP